MCLLCAIEKERGYNIFRTRRVFCLNFFILNFVHKGPAFFMHNDTLHFMKFVPLSCACPLKGSGSSSAYLLAVGLILVCMAFCLIIKPANFKSQNKLSESILSLGNEN